MKKDSQYLGGENAVELQCNSDKFHFNFVFLE